MKVCKCNEMLLLFLSLPKFGDFLEYHNSIAMLLLHYYNGMHFYKRLITSQSFFKIREILESKLENFIPSMATEKPDNSSVIIFLFIENLNIAVSQEPRSQCRKHLFIYFTSFSNDNLR